MLHVVDGESAANPMKFCVFWITRGLLSVLMYTMSMLISAVSDMMWRITASCWIAFGGMLFISRMVVGKVYLSQTTGRLMSLKVYFLSSVIWRVWFAMSLVWRIRRSSNSFQMPDEDWMDVIVLGSFSCLLVCGLFLL